MYNFEKVAVRCDTFEQILHLKELAKSQGLLVSASISDDGDMHFAKMDGVYCNFDGAIMGETEISYADFIASGLPSVEQMVASTNIL